MDRIHEIIFLVREREGGGYFARALGHGIFTQGDTREELERMARDAARCHFEPEHAAPRFIYEHYVQDEVSSLLTVDYLVQRGDGGSLDRFRQLLDRVPAVPPDPSDQLE